MIKRLGMEPFFSVEKAVAAARKILMDERREYF